MGPTSSPIKAGIVTYRRAGADFEGTWSHADIAGALARETVSGVGAGDFLGAWSVTVFSPSGTGIFLGHTEIRGSGTVSRIVLD